MITDCDLYFSVLRLMEDRLSNHLVGGKVRFIYIYCLVGNFLKLYCLTSLKLNHVISKLDRSTKLTAV